MIRRRPSTAVVSLLSACMLSRVRALASAFSVCLSAFLANWDGDPAHGVLDVEVGVPDAEQRHVGELAHCGAVGVDAGQDDRAPFFGGVVVVAPGDGQARGQALDVPLEGSGQGFVEVVDVEDEPPLGGGERAEVRQVRVPAQLDPQARGGCRGEVGGHRQCRAPVVGERRDQHPAVPDRHQLGHPRLGLTQQQRHRIPVRRRFELAVRSQRCPGAGRLALGSPLGAGRMLHGHHLPPLSACSATLRRQPPRRHRSSPRCPPRYATFSPPHALRSRGP